jgi:hypothetical protein
MTQAPPLPHFHFVFDVESIGLHGEAFAVGFVVLDAQWVLQEERLWVIPSQLAKGAEEDRQWVKQHIQDVLAAEERPLEANCTNARTMRSEFFERWVFWKANNADMYADCTWPVESGLLSACIRDAQEQGVPNAAWLGPYPVVDIMSLERAARWAGFAQELKRDESLFPLHHPLADAKYSALRLQRFFTWLSSQTR